MLPRTGDGGKRKKEDVFLVFPVSKKKKKNSVSRSCVYAEGRNGKGKRRKKQRSLFRWQKGKSVRIASPPTEKRRRAATLSKEERRGRLCIVARRGEKGGGKENPNLLSRGGRRAWLTPLPRGGENLYLKIKKGDDQAPSRGGKAASLFASPGPEGGEKGCSFRYQWREKEGEGNNFPLPLERKGGPISIKEKRRGPKTFEGGKGGGGPIRSLFFRGGKGKKKRALSLRRKRGKGGCADDIVVHQEGEESFRWRTKKKERKKKKEGGKMPLVYFLLYKGGEGERGDFSAILEIQQGESFIIFILMMKRGENFPSPWRHLERKKKGVLCTCGGTRSQTQGEKKKGKTFPVQGGEEKRKVIDFFKGS